MNHKFQGTALLFLQDIKINSVNLNSFKASRKNLTRKLNKLNFKVHVETNLTKQQTIAVLKEYANDPFNTISDCFLCFYSSIGNELIDLPAIFSSQNNLINKPKLFFINACKEYKKCKWMKQFETKICADSDTLIYFSFEDEYKLISNGCKQTIDSIFIQNINKAFNKYGKREQLLEMMYCIKKQKSEMDKQMTLGKSAL